MTIQFRPAVRENTPLIIGIAGPTKSGKTYSAHRIARGLANGGRVIMLNAEGARGHQYADTFTYDTCDLVPPHRYGVYEDILREAVKLKPGAIIVDSLSHAHDGPGGFLEWHEEELDRIAGQDYDKRNRANFTAWITPKAAENSFRYALLEMPCPVILCMRAKEKLKIIPGKPPVDLGWQPIVGEGIASETLFTLMLPPHSRGVPDLAISELREPFDALIPKGKPIDEDLGRALAKWATGAGSKPARSSPNAATDELSTALKELKLDGQDDDAKKRRGDLLQELYGTRAWSAITKLEPGVIRDGIAKLRARFDAPPSAPAPASTDADVHPEFGDPQVEMVEALRIARSALKRPLEDVEFEGLCEEVLGSKEFERADATALADLLSILRGYNAGESVAKKTVDKVRKAVA